MGKKQQPALAIEYRPLEGLIPYALNARTHSDAQVAQLAGSIREFGWTNPVLVDGESGIIAGHGRVLAARKLGMATVPCIELRHLTDLQRRAYILADNRLGELAGWDEAMLAIELADLQEQGVDMAITGFTAEDIAEVLADPAPKGGEDGAADPAVEAMLDEAWRQVTRDWTAHIERAAAGGLLSAKITPGTAAWHFIQAKYLGGEYPGYASLAFCPQRFWTSGERKRPVPECIAIAATDGPAMRGLRWAMDEEPVLDRALQGSLPMAGSRLPLDFPADLARDLIAEFAPAGGRVLDPCHGWGGRYVGFLLSEAGEYVGCDPSPHAHAGLERTREALERYAGPGKASTFLAQPFEDAELPGLFDFALTSPPYFDLEKYAGTDTSTTRFPAFDAWVQGFYLPLLRKVAAHLKPGGVFALQVGSQKYPMAQTAIDNAAACGLELVEKRNAGMNNSLQDTPEEKAEAVLMLRAMACK